MSSMSINGDPVRFRLDPETRPAAEAFLDFLRSDAAAPEFTALGLDPIR